MPALRVAASLAMVAVGAGCGGEFPPVELPPGMGRLVVGLRVEGPDSDEEKEGRCIRQLREQGARVAHSEDPPASIRLILKEGHNQLLIYSKRRGLVLNQSRPAWAMAELCADALVRASEVVIADARQDQREEAPPPRPSPPSPSPPARASLPPPVSPPSPPSPAPAARPAGRRLSVLSDPPGATITIDGATVGTAPIRERPVSAGDHVLEARWADETWVIVGAAVRSRRAHSVTLRRME